MPSGNEPWIMSAGADPKADVRRMYEDGYSVIGVSAFVGAAAAQSGAIEQAKKVGAAAILIGAKYRNTETGSIPITTPTATTSYSTGNVNAFGSGGSAFGTYAGSTTTYGTQTTWSGPLK
jgi:serine protease Do